MMLKKSLLALSLAAAVGSANAATATKIDPNGAGVTALDAIQTISSQAGLSTIELKDIDITLTDVATVISNYGTLAKITVSFDGATLSASSDAELTHATPANLTTTVKYPDAKTVEFTATASTIAAGDVLTLSGIDLSVTPGTNVTMTVSATSSVAGVEIDSAAGVVAAYVDEFTAKAGTKFDAVIDVDTARKKFTGAALGDTAVVTVTDLATDHGDTSASLGAGDIVVTLNGDFSFLDTNGDGKLTALDKGTLTGTGAVTAAAGLQSASQTGSAAGNYSFTAGTNGTIVLPAQSYTADVLVKYTNSLNVAGTDTTSGIAMGSWTLNGDSDDIAFMPFGGQYANSITVTNMSALAGEITVTLTDGGKSVTAEVGVAAAKSVTQIGKEVAALAAANGMTQANVNVIVNATNTTVVGVYYSKADGDRVLTK